MANYELVTAADLELMQGLAQRVTAVRPDLISAGASYGELAWIWGKGQAADGATWRRRLWHSDGNLVGWAWAFLPRQARLSDGSVRGAAHGYQPALAALADDGEWTQLNQRDLIDTEEPELPGGFRFRTADEAGP